MLGSVLFYAAIYQSSANLTEGLKVAKITDNNFKPGHTVLVPCAGDNHTTVTLLIKTNGEITVHSVLGNSTVNTKNANGCIFYPSQVFGKPTT